jgi:hypothetical protein
MVTKGPLNVGKPAPVGYSLLFRRFCSECAPLLAAVQRDACLPHGIQRSPNAILSFPILPSMLPFHVFHVWTVQTAVVRPAS